MVKQLLGAMLMASMLSGCAAALVAGGAGAADSATDRRTLGSQLDDNNVEIKAALAISEDKSLSDRSRVSVTSYNGNVLLVGQTPTDDLRSRAENNVKNLPGVNKVYNLIRIGNPISFTTATNDTWLTSKVKTQLLLDERVSGRHIKVVTENGEVFLMGLVKDGEADIAVDIARNVNGVAKVFKVFEYL